KRKWKELGIVVGSCVVATLLPALLIGARAEWEFLKSFYGYTQAQFGPQGLEIENFSLWGTLGRLLVHAKAFEYPDGHPVFVNLLSMDPWIIRIAAVGLAGTIIAAAYAAARRDVPGPESGGRSPSQRSFLLTLLAMNLVSTLTEDHHLVGLMVVYLWLLVSW